MAFAKTTFLLVLLMASLCVFATTKEEPKDCSFDRKQSLSLSQDDFDQDPHGGWRAIAHRPGCLLIGADLIRDYRKFHAQSPAILYWHEGQLRAEAGQNSAAVELMKKSYKRTSEDRSGWNQYVDATIAFLKSDKPGLAKAQAALANVPLPRGMDSKGKTIQVTFPDGTIKKMKWPPNTEVVEGLVTCFGKPYSVAYSSAECRPKQ